MSRYLFYWILPLRLFISRNYSGGTNLAKQLHDFKDNDSMKGTLVEFQAASIGQMYKIRMAHSDVYPQQFRDLPNRISYRLK